MTQTLIYPHLTSVLSDTITPVSAYLALRDVYPNSLLLESGMEGGNPRPVSYLCCQPIAGITLHQETITCTYPSGKKQQTNTGECSVAGKLEAFLSAFNMAEDYPLPFDYAGLFGYMSYDAVRYFEPYTTNAPAQDIPQLHYALYRLVLVFDHTTQNLHMIYNQPEQETFNPALISETLHLLANPDMPTYPFQLTATENTGMSDTQFLALVQQGRYHCQQGDVFQMVLSRRFSQSFSGDDFNVYRALRSVNPSPYQFYFDYGNHRLMGASPEAQLKVHQEQASLFPIAGTMPHTGNAVTDEVTAAQLKADPKENAEHVMLVDLARNDLNRHCDGVTVPKFKTIQHFSHVMHLVSEVTGTLKPGTSAVQLLTASYPAGTLSGAPKVRAMQLIEQYEPLSRDFYGGCIGFLGFNGHCIHAIMIRSLLSKDQTLHYQAGAGIVIHSVPERELEEVQHKLQSVRRAIAIAQTL